MAAKTNRQPVQVSGEIIARLRDFSEQTGISMTRAVDDAISQYLDGPGKQLLAALTMKPKR